MTIQQHESETLEVRTPESVVFCRQRVREWAVKLGLGLVDQTKLVTAASELARNTVDHGGGGQARIQVIQRGRRQGLRLTFTDQGPGITDINMALEDGYSSVGGLGMGLGGSKRLVSEFEIDSQPGEGTTISVIKWL